MYINNKGKIPALYTPVLLNDTFTTTPYLTQLRLGGYHCEVNRRVGIIDTGINPNHPEFSDITVEMDRTLYYGSGIDDAGHGTYCASKLVGKTCGLYKNTGYLYSVKAVDVFGTMDASWFINALIKCRTKDLDVLSISLGLPRTHFTQSEVDAIETALQNLVNDGVVVVVAAGNGGNNGAVMIPASFEMVNTVGAVDENFSPAMFTQVIDEVDVCQVGVGVYGAWYQQVNGEYGYVMMNGTSMATPIVANIASKLSQDYVDAYNAQHPINITHAPESFISTALKMHTIDVNAEGWDNTTGVGFCTMRPAINVIEFDLTGEIVNHSITEGEIDVNGEEVEIEASPILLYDSSKNLYKTMIELRGILESAGGIVNYNNGHIKVIV